MSTVATPLSSLELSDNSVVLGESLFFFGKNFRQGGEEGITRLTFDGVYVGDDGSRTE